MVFTSELSASSLVNIIVVSTCTTGGVSVSLISSDMILRGYMLRLAS